MAVEVEEEEQKRENIWGRSKMQNSWYCLFQIYQIAVCNTLPESSFSLCLCNCWWVVTQFSQMKASSFSNRWVLTRGKK